jgi:hypothetical protein
MGRIWLSRSRSSSFLLSPPSSTSRPPSDVIVAA